MRVLMVGKLPNSVTGGVENYTKLLLERLTDIDFVVLAQSSRHVPARLRSNMTIVWPYRILGSSQFLQAVLFALCCMITLPFVLLRTNPDVVHVQYGNFFDLLLTIVPGILGYKTVVTMHVSDSWRHLRIGITRQISALLLRAVSAVVCISNFQCEMLKKLHIRPAKIFHIPLCIEDEFYELPREMRKEGKTRMLYLGRVKPEKGIRELLVAFKKVKKEIYSAELLIVGPISSVYKKELTKLISQLKIMDTRLIGPQTDITVKIGFYDSSHVFVCPSYVDTSPLSIIEAMSRGCAIVASNIAGIPLLVQSAGLLVPPGDIDKLANAIISVCRSKKHRAVYSSHALTQARQYNCRSVLTQYSALYATIAKC